MGREGSGERGGVNGGDGGEKENQRDMGAGEGGETEGKRWHAANGGDGGKVVR